MSEFHKRRNELYAEFPAEAQAYEYEFHELQARLAEAERLLRSAELCGNGGQWDEDLHAFLGATDSAPAVQVCEDCSGTGDTFGSFACETCNGTGLTVSTGDPTSPG